MSINQLGVVGLGTMGANIARNAARNGAKVAVYNRTSEKTDEFIQLYASEGEFVGCHSYDEMIDALEGPRAILLMVKAGSAVDAVIQDLLPHLSKGDILIDGGNSHFPDTQRRFDELLEHGIHFVGMGVSGGEEGALEGPSMMPGGDEKAFKQLADLLSKMSADDGEGGKCVSFLGKGGSGHFVKMVHNGIEYGIMQLIAESYDLLQSLGGYTNEQLADTFTAWNATPELDSFLMEITADIFRQKDDKGTGDLIDSIKGAAKQKGTGKWTSQAALDYGVAIPTITAGVDGRILSGAIAMRERSKDLPEELDTSEPEPAKEKLRSMVKTSLELSIICAYQQGFDLIERVSDEEGWDINLSECARIWRGGCIIRSAQLVQWQQAFGKDTHKAKAASEAIRNRFNGERQTDWRKMLEFSNSRGIPTLALSASLNYYDSVRRSWLPQNLTQAQRDYFGAHTYERIDQKGSFHTDWNHAE